MSSKLNYKTKRVYTLLRREFPETYITLCTGIGCAIAAKELFEYGHTNNFNGYMVTGFGISAAAVSYLIHSLIRNK
jgi:hypothetical protein